ncbi:MAG TPA: response regulator [Burkholderiaceae bacterium]|jgi:CheY-like chemotaxis protein|nr:response regulator [Burkholderiaceae bacterium]
MEATASAARRVLLIDDNPDAVEALAELLRLSGHNVRTAGDGPSGLALATQFEPEFVLCDLGLPGMSGYEVALALRALPGAARSAVIVALTGHGTDEDRQRSASAGFDVHLLKPIDPAVIEGLLEKR